MSNAIKLSKKNKSLPSRLLLKLSSKPDRSPHPFPVIKHWHSEFVFLQFPQEVPEPRHLGGFAFGGLALSVTL
jgi:hypothetical protein